MTDSATNGATEAGTIRLVLADDHAVLREGLRTLIDGQPDMEVVGEASDGDEATQLARDLSPDVVIMDLSMPRCGGIEAITQMRQLGLRSRAVVLSMHDDHGYLRAALAAGAAGYVPKGAPADQLLEAIRQVHQNRSYIAVALSDGSLERVVEQSDEQTKTPLQKLTEREAGVLEAVAQGHTHAQIAARLHLSTKTIDTYRQRISQKLGLRTRAELVRFAIETGLLSSSRLSEPKP